MSKNVDGKSTVADPYCWICKWFFTQTGTYIEEAKLSWYDRFYARGSVFQSWNFISNI